MPGREFLFGGWTNGADCPIYTVKGERMDDNSPHRMMAEWYDDKAKAEEPKRSGILDEPTARDYWLSAIEKLRRRGREMPAGDAEYYHEIADVGVEIADALGWNVGDKLRKREAEA